MQPSRAIAQKSIGDSAIGLTMINVCYSGDLTGADLADRFGFTHHIGIESGYKFSNNFYVYSGLRALFGNNPREAVATNVVQQVGDSSSGFVPMALGSDGRYYEVRFFERGYTVPIVAGKVFRLSEKQNPNSGLYLEAGFQYIQHRIKIEVIGNNVPQLNPEYRKGYDRLSSGIGLVQGIGYRHFSSSRLANFYVGFEASENFTAGRREINFDTGLPGTGKRLDLLYGFKIGWCFPIYSEAPDQKYYY